MISFPAGSYTPVAGWDRIMKINGELGVVFLMRHSKSRKALVGGLPGFLAQKKVCATVMVWGNATWNGVWNGAREGATKSAGKVCKLVICLDFGSLAYSLFEQEVFPRDEGWDMAIRR